MLINLLLILKQNQRRLSEICLCIWIVSDLNFFLEDSKKLISVQFSEHNFLFFFFVVVFVFLFESRNTRNDFTFYFSFRKPPEIRARRRLKPGGKFWLIILVAPDSKHTWHEAVMVPLSWNKLEGFEGIWLINFQMCPSNNNIWTCET